MPCVLRLRHWTSTPALTPESSGKPQRASVKSPLRHPSVRCLLEIPSRWPHGRFKPLATLSIVRRSQIDEVRPERHAAIGGDSLWARMADLELADEVVNQVVAVVDHVSLIDREDWRII